MIKYEHRSENSKPFVNFWESLTSKKVAKERTRYVLKPIKKYHKQAKKILEIDCGIGEVLANLPNRYTIYGLDLEGDYIEFCRKKIPEANSSFPTCTASRLMKNSMPYSRSTQSTF